MCDLRLISVGITYLSVVYHLLLDFDITDGEYQIICDTAIVVSGSGWKRINGEYRHVKDEGALGYWTNTQNGAIINRQIAETNCIFVFVTSESVNTSHQLAFLASGKCFAPPPTVSKFLKIIPK